MELPHPWEIRESKKYPGRCYYFNSETHESQWIRPVRYPGTDPKKPWPPAMYLFCILIKYKGSLGGDGISRTLDEARSLAEQIFSELQKGDSSFPEMANKYSDDPETRERDGELGWVVWGKFDEKFEKTAWQLKIGETSHPFKTDKGIYLILRRG
ncbi:putative peptidyl-prolyl cis-trans isomerase dodo [Histomonas meleagridis]|uniref:putative peptidyl-prolyl cis-trans isomerase dodo n=1 Tax=Histomonas meleagridis TaxID=135588 RepID=UPI0035594AD6|nr:putative peptidyl-prolyl cis-trans isomerase dodo [Histomonas meleagridis]KAH0802626.1 putative peptidyl-prolyl cis-trans isomerase dodo [Histomonas meleagridis]